MKGGIVPALDHCAMSRALVWKIVIALGALHSTKQLHEGPVGPAT